MSKSKPLLQLNALAFADAIPKVTISTARDDSRPVLTGVLFEATERKLTMIGVDGFRLSRKVVKLEKGTKDDLSQIVPAKALDEVASIIKDTSTEKDSVEIHLLDGMNQMLFVIGDFQLSTRLIEGKFPDYEQILPKEASFSFTILREELESVVKIAGIFARNVIGNKTKFIFNPKEKKLKLAATVIDVGQNESVANLTEVQGDEMETAYNARFLADMLNVVTGEEIIFETNGVTAPGVFKDKADKDFLHVIMPMRLE